MFLVVFAALAADFARPTKKEIPWIHIDSNQFWSCFDNIWSARALSREGASIQTELDNIASEFIRRSQITHL